MKKKYLLLTFLALAIVTSLTAGTLAIYTSTQNFGDAEITAKKFVFTAATGERYPMDIKLAPTETQTYPFTVTNTGNNVTAEVPMYYAINASTAPLFTAMPGLTAELLKGDEVVKSITSGDLTYGGDEDSTHFAASASATHDYTLRLTWVSDGTTNASQTTAGENASSASFDIAVTATQDTTPQTFPTSN